MKRAIAAIAAALALSLCAPVAAQWRDLEPTDVAVMTIGGQRVVIVLNRTFAPVTSAAFVKRVQAGFYDGLSFYRVIEGFVAQGGDGSDLDPDATDHLTLPAEFELANAKGLDFVAVQAPDLFAPETGFVDGFAAARLSEHAANWLTHCPGVVAMARGNAPDSGASDFYIVIGQAPRYLDRNLTIFGRVISGMDVVQRIRRGPAAANGVIEDAARQTRIDSIRMASDLPAADRPALQVADTGHAQFAETLASRRHRKHQFFHTTPPAVLDVCQVPVPTRPLP